VGAATGKKKTIRLQQCVKKDTCKPNEEIPSIHSEEDYDSHMLNDSEPPNLEATSTPGHAIIPQNSDQQGRALRVTAEVPRTPFVIPANSLMPEVAEEESTIIARFSSMNLEAEEGQICSQTIDQASSHTAGAWSAEDPLLLVLQKLRRDPSAEFKSPEQRKLVESVISGHHTIGILPTGSGKSLAYELPPICQGQLTIAVLPFKVLISQAEQNCVINDARFIDEERLVIMAVETLLSSEMLK